MEIVAYEPQHAHAAAKCFNRLIARLPHCYPTSDVRLNELLTGRARESERVAALEQAGAWLACDGDRVVGLAVVAMQPAGDDRDEPRGTIRFLAYEPGRREEGQLLLDQAHRHIRDHGAREVVAFEKSHRWPVYHRGMASLTDRLAHVLALFGQNGYRRERGEVFLDWPDLKAPQVRPAEVDVELSIEDQPTDALLAGFTIKAIHAGEVVGECVNVSCGNYSPGTLAEEWCLTKWLAVEDEWQGRYVGAHLLTRALQMIRTRGYKHAQISTDVDNHRAVLFYSNFGYEASDWTWRLVHTLD